ncbi:MAG: DUF503 domain-containing protein [Armatimonadetes bacterium]|nr:DUF503 domain-containing protein [Armatimonadota bacterium]
MATVIGLCTLELHIPAATSLKDKRSVLKSMLEGLRSRFNVSAAEVEHLDLWQRATVAITCVSNSQTFCNQVLDKTVEWVEHNPRVYVTRVELEFL